ncbi:MAG: hypothetical protein DMG43_08855 [Acidobacteria bacterium]|nr:MAG: hypothetical protein DMG43_08855 [Acidobacteriota bacterium]
MKRVKEVELEFGRKLDNALADILQDLGYPLPESHQVKASLLDSNGRKKRGNASADNWSPVLGRIEIRFEPVAQEQKQINSRLSQTAEKESPAKAEKLSKDIAGVLPAEADLLIALDRAEARPGWNFVPLKKFRDEILPQEHLPSLANTDVHHRSVLESAIEKKFVLVGKVPNPKSPQFPVTTIRLNRLMPEVKAVLGQNASSDLDFHPVEISGEPLSATILRERR